MPNWCMTTMVIDGYKADVEKIRNLLLTWTSKEYQPSDFGVNWLGNIVLGAGFKIGESLEKDGGLYCRGFVDYIGEIEELDDGLYSFDVEYESAWGPVPEMWKAVMQKHAPHCGLYWYAEEPGSEIYMTNDVGKKYFDSDFVVDSHLENKESPLYKDFQATSMFQKDDLKEALISVFGKDTLKNLIEKLKNVPLNDGEWLSVHPMTYEM